MLILTLLYKKQKTYALKCGSVQQWQLRDRLTWYKNALRLDLDSILMEKVTAIYATSNNSVSFTVYSAKSQQQLPQSALYC